MKKILKTALCLSLVLGSAAPFGVVEAADGAATARDESPQSGDAAAGRTESAVSAQSEAEAMPAIVVTAQRKQKSQLDTPATTTVITADEMQRAGYRNVFEAIDQQIGSTSTSYGETGQDFGFSAGRITLRGYDRGTLVMVNGIPMNLKNYPSTESIPMEMVDRIEIVKGAASTLYGGEAMGGVINIILKQPSKETSAVKSITTWGDRFKKQEAYIGTDRFILDVSKEWSKDVPHSNAFGPGKLSWTDWWVGKGQKNRIGLIAKLTDELSLNYDYTEGEITRGGTRYRMVRGSLVPSSTRYDYRYDDYRQTAGLVYHGRDNGIHAVLGYNYRKVDGYDYLRKARLSSNERLDGEIFDIQKEWKSGKDSLIAGYTWRRDGVKVETTDRRATRLSNALYLSWSKQWSRALNVTLGLRGESISDPEKDQHVLMPQFQTDYKIDKDTAWYINIGRAFQMPAIDDGFRYSHLRTAGLHPESGWTYETGIKHRGKGWTASAAVYYMRMKNKLGWAHDEASNEYYAVNSGDFRNLGFEAELTKQLTPDLRLRLGGSVSNPEVRDPSSRDHAWRQDAGRLEGLVGLDYQKAKWQGSLDFKYLGDREYYAPSAGRAQDVPSKLALNLDVSYAPDKDDVLTVGIYNLLDRDNYSNRYGNLDLPRNIRVTYTHAF